MSDVAPLTVQLPEAWRSWPLGLEVMFHYPDGRFNVGADFDWFAASTLEEAARKLFEAEGDPSYFPGYRLHTKGVVAAVSVWVTWPLSRKSGPPTVERRDGPRTDAVGLSHGADNTLLYLCKEPIGALGYSSQIKLSTAGRTVEDAVAGYELVAPQMRAIRKMVRGGR